MRVDKFLSETGTATRSEAAKAVKKGGVFVNGAPCPRADTHIDPEKDRVSYFGKEIVYKKFRYIILNKPRGYVSATEDGRDPTVLELLPREYMKFGLFPCGRLDKNTLGLMLLTNDGELAHRLLSPKHHVEKTYEFDAKFPLSSEDKTMLERGITLDDGYVTMPSRIELTGDGTSGRITITEGKYHQIKRMLDAVGNKITMLKRIRFGPLVLEDNLCEGMWRELTEEETELLRRSGGGSENIREE